MKVVYILNIFPKITETFILNEMVEMQKKGVEISVFALDRGTEIEKHSGVDWIREVHYFRRRWGFFREVWAHLYWIFRRPLRYLRTWGLAIFNGYHIRKYFITQLYNLVIIDRMRGNHVHAHFAEEAANIAMLYHALSGAPYTFTSHAHDIFDNPQANYPLKTSLAKRHITISEFNKRYLVERFGLDPGRIEVIHCGVDFGSLRPVVGRSGGKPLILTIARLHEEKRLDVLIDTLELLRLAGTDFEAVVIGEGTERVSLESKVRTLGLSEKVRLLGNRTHDEVFEWLSRASVMALSSRAEGIPVSLMEAMAMRVPVVATCITGIPELIEDGESGFLVPSGDAEALAQKIRAVLSDPDLARRFVENGYRKVFHDFNLRTETDKLLALWSTAP